MRRKPKDGRRYQTAWFRDDAGRRVMEAIEFQGPQRVPFIVRSVHPDDRDPETPEIRCAPGEFRQRLTDNEVDKLLAQAGHPFT